MSPWLLPDRQTLSKKFSQPFRWGLYPRYYALQLHRIAIRPNRAFEDLV